MSNSIDQRIVEMQFDNSQFEKGIASTLASLKQFDGALQSTKGGAAFEKIQAAAGKLDFSSATSQVTGFSSTLESLKDVASNVFDRVTNTVASFAKGFSVVNGLLNAGVAGIAIHGGWNRASAINQGEFKLQGLLKDSEEGSKAVELAMQNANDAVSGTAYALDAAVTASANLIASGRTIGDQLESDLLLIADLAGATGRDYESISNIMSTIAAQGKVGGMQLEQFAHAGLNATAALSKYLKVSQADVRDMVSKGLIDFDTFKAAMNETFGGNAKKANDTFEGSLANIRSALSRTTDELFRYGQKAMVPVFNGIRESINGVNWALKPLMGTWKDAEEKVQKGVLIRGIEDFGKELGRAFHNWGGEGGKHSKKLEEGTFGFLSGNDSKSWSSLGPIRFRKLFTEIADAVEGPIEEINKGLFDFSYAVIEIFASVREVFRLTLEFLSPIGKALGDVFGNGAFAQFAKDFRYKFTEPILKALADFHVSEGFVNVFRTIFDVIFGLGKLVGGAAVQGIGIGLKFLFDAISSVGLALGSFFDFVDGAIRGASSVGDAISGMFDPIFEAFDSIGIKGVGKFFSGLADGIGTFFKALRGEEGANEHLSELLGWFDTGTQNLLTSVGDALSLAGEKIKEFFSFVKENAFDKGVEFFENARNLFGPIIGDVGEGLFNFFSTLAGGLDEISGGALSSFVDGITTLIGAVQGDQGAIQKLSGFGENVSKFFGAAFSKAADAIGKFVKAISPMASAFKDFASGAAETFLKALSGIIEFIGPIIGTIKDKVVSIATGIGEAFANAGFSFDPIIDFFKNLGSSIGEFIDNISSNGFDFGKVLDFFGSIKDDFGKLGDDVGPAFESFTKGVGQAIYDNLEGPLKDLWGWVTSITNPLDSLANGFSNAMEKISSVFGGGLFSKETAGDGGFDALAGVDTAEVVNQGFDFVMALDTVGSAIANPVDTIKGVVAGGFGGIGEGLHSAMDDIFNWDKWSQVEDFGKKILSLGASGGAVYAIYHFGEALRKAGGLFESIKSIPKSIGKVADGLKNVTTAIEGSIKTKAILNIAIAVGILVGSLVALSVSDLDKAKEALPMVLTLLAGVSLIVMAFGKLAGTDGFEMAGITAFSNSMLALSVAIGIMSLVISALGAMPPAQLKQGEQAVIEFGIIVAALVYVMGKIPTGIASMAGTFIGLAVLFGTMAMVATILGAIPEAVFNRGTAALIGMAVGISMIVAVISSFGNAFAVATSGVLSLAASITLLAGAMIILGSQDPGRLEAGGLAIAQLMIAMGVFIYAMSHLVKPTDIAISTKAMLTMTVAIVILAGAIAGLAMISTLGGDLEGATSAIVSLVVVMSLLVAVAGNFGPQLTGLGPMFISLAVSIAVLTAALSALSLIGFEKTGPALLILAGAILVFVGAMAGLGLISKYILPALGPMIAMTVAVAVLTAALIALSNVPMKSLLVAIIALSAGLGIMALALIAFGGIGYLFGDGLLTLSSAFVVFAAGVAILAVSVLTIAASALIFTEAMKNMSETGPEAVDALIECIKRLGRGLYDAAPDMALGVMGIGYAIISGLLGLIPMAVVAIATFLGQMLGALVAFAPALAEGAVVVAVGLITGLSKGIREHGDEVLAAIGDLFLAIFESIGGMFSDAVNMFSNWLYDVTGGLMGNAPAAKDAAQEYGSQMSEGFKEGNTMSKDMNAETDKMLADLAEKYPFMKTAGIGASTSVSKGAIEGAKGFDFMKNLGLDDASLGQSISSVVEQVRKMGGSVPPVLQEMLDNGMGDISLARITDENGVFDPAAMEQMGINAGEAGGEGFHYGVKTSVESKDIAGVIVNPDTIDQGAVEEAFANVGEGAANAFSDSFTESIANVDGSGPVQKAADSMKMESKFQEAGKVDGQAATKGMEAGLKDMSSKVKTAATNASRTVKNQSGSMRSAGSETGRAVVSGLVSGMNSQIPSLERAVARICALAEKAAKAKLAIKSPSRVFAQIGEYTIQGMIVGIESMQSDLKATMAETGDIASRGLKLQSSAVDELLSGMPDQPVIRPVLDLTDYEYGLRQMYGMSTYMPMVGAQLVGRAVSGSPVGQAAAGGNVIQIELNYNADADANQIVMDIANGLSQKLMMEGS